MIEKEKRAEMVRYWWSRAEESLASAHREFRAGSFSFTMNRLYYAAGSLIEYPSALCPIFQSVLCLLSGLCPFSSATLCEPCGLCERQDSWNLADNVPGP